MSQRFHIPAILSTLVFATILVIFLQEDWLSLGVYLSILTISSVFLYKIGIETIDPYFPMSLFMLAFIAKLIGSTAKYLISFEVYHSGDALLYHELGQYVSRFFKNWDFSVFGQISKPHGTANVIYFTGILYTLLPSSLAGIFFLFASLAFIGSIFFYRSFCLAFPDTSPSFFRFMIFFLPSILFWPSSLGKDACIFFCSGFFAYGLVKYLRTTQFSSLLWAIMGGVLTWIIRPHIASFMFIALGMVYFLFPKMRASQHPIVWMVGVIGVIGVSIVILQSTGKYLSSFGLNEVSVEAVGDFYDLRQKSSTEGRSAFTQHSVLSPIGAVQGFVTVLFRPFIWEAHNPQALMSSIESVLWLGIMWYRRKVFFARIRSIKNDPLICFSILYCVMVILALTTIANFGIIARQRVMFLPFLWMLFA